MTGFGAAEGRVGALRVSVELRTVNHRFFNPSLKLPTALGRWEGEVRETLRQRVARGHVTQLRELAARHGLPDTIDVATVLRLPDVLRAEESPEEVEGTVAELVEI